MFISFAALTLSMITLPTNCYATPALVTSYGDDVQLGVQVDSYIEAYSGNNEYHVRCYNLRTLTPYGTLGEYQMLTYLFTIDDGNVSSDFAVQYQFGGESYNTLQVTTYVRTYSGAFGSVTYDNSKTSNIYLQDCWLKYNNGTQGFGDIYYTASDFYSTSRQSIAGWNLTDNTLIDSFEFGFNIVFFPPTFANQDGTSSYENGYYAGYDKGKTDGYNTGYDAGESAGYTSGYNTGLATGEQTGYQDGYNAGLNVGNRFNFFSLFGAIADTPIMILRNLLGFEVFGVSAISILMSMITGTIAIFLIRKFL